MANIFLDHASTTPCDPRVFEAMKPFFNEQNGNASSMHQQGRAARLALENSRDLLAAFLGGQPAEITFTSGASESNNQAIFSTARAMRHKGKHIVSSAIEHHSILEPLHQLEEDGWQVSFVKPGVDGIVTLEAIKAAIRKDTVLVCLQHANNEIGTIQPVATVGRFCRERGIYFLVDATQTVGHIPVNVKEMNCDLLSLSAHKFYGPQGVGALYIRQNINCPSFILGGDQERGRRAGTQHITGIIGLAEAIKICRQQMVDDAAREMLLRDRIIDFVLKEISLSFLTGKRNQRLSNNAHFCFEGISGEDLVNVLDLSGVAVSMGSACTQGMLEPSHVLKAIGLSDKLALGSLRVTVGRSTKSEDVNFFLEQLNGKVKQLRAS